MIPSLSDKVLEIAKLDFALMLWTEDNWQITLAGDAVIRRPDHVAEHVDTTAQEDQPPESVRALIGRKITGLSVSDRGDLTLSLDDFVIECPVGVDYESWQLNGPRGEIIVCGPGGRLTEWGPRRD
ncbi:DUF6188 family protein [Intrasporangium flavum]|uniref:DUF6188 family protein n=1 Tax=Intrasporangium flavum TaxID=1428657 RepID=UPI001A961EB7|nr:DUF6188 family protein [Intrasporangium flavum]